jgi:hypothetical protein
LEVLP